MADVTGVEKRISHNTLISIDHFNYFRKY